MVPRQTTACFTVTLTGDFYDASGKPKYRDLGMAALDAQPRWSNPTDQGGKCPVAPEMAQRILAHTRAYRRVIRLPQP